MAADQLGRELAGLPQAVARTLEARAAVLQRLARQRAPRRTGALQRGIVVRSTADRIVASLPAEYATLDAGGVVRARAGRHLSVPVDPGAALLSGPRADLGLFPIRLRDGRLFLAARRGRELLIRWRLVPEVRHRPTRFLSGAVEETAAELPDQLLADLTEALDAR